MNFLPSLSHVQDMAAAGTYDVLPVSCELLSDFITPIEALKILKHVSSHCYLLESAAANETWGRYSFLGFDPRLEITCTNGLLKAGNLTIRTNDPSAVIRQILGEYKSPRFDYLPPFTGGLAGYFSYDYFGYCEPSVRCDSKKDDTFKDLDLMLFDKVIAFDHVRQKIILMVNMSLTSPKASYHKAVLKLKQLAELLKTGEKECSLTGKLLGTVTPMFDKNTFCSMVEEENLGRGYLSDRTFQLLQRSL